MQEQDRERIDKVNEDLSLIRIRNGIAFGTDSYLLSAFVRRRKYELAVDLGAGTGVISMFCAQRRSIHKMLAVELQVDLIDVIRRNALLNQLEHKVEPIEADIRDFPPKDMFGCADLVVSNPPYFKQDTGLQGPNRVLASARHELNGGIDAFCACAGRLLGTGGSFFVVYRPERLADLLSALRENHLEPKRIVFTYPDVDSSPSLLLVESKKNGAPGVRIARPLVIYRSSEDRSSYSEDMQRIYDTFDMEFLFREEHTK